MVKNLQQWMHLPALVLLLIAGAVACQAGPQPQASILDECARPTVPNRGLVPQYAIPQRGAMTERRVSPIILGILLAGGVALAHPLTMRSVGMR